MNFNYLNCSTWNTLENMLAVITNFSLSSLCLTGRVLVLLAERERRGGANSNKDKKF